MSRPYLNKANIKDLIIKSCLSLVIGFSFVIEYTFKTTIIFEIDNLVI